MTAATTFARKHKARTIMAAVPTGSDRSVAHVSPYVDSLVCLNIREGYSFAVADAYSEWHDLDEKEVQHYLQNVKKWAT